MPHSYLKVVGNPEYRCNNSSPRYMRENHYALLVFRLKISYVFKYKISITLLLFLCLGKGFPNPIAKVAKILDKFLSLNDFLYFLRLFERDLCACIKFSSHYFAFG